MGIFLWLIMRGSWASLWRMWLIIPYSVCVFYYLGRRGPGLVEKVVHSMPSSAPTSLLKSSSIGSYSRTLFDATPSCEL